MYENPDKHLDLFSNSVLHSSAGKTLMKNAFRVEVKSSRREGGGGGVFDIKIMSGVEGWSRAEKVQDWGQVRHGGVVSRLQVLQ